MNYRDRDGITGGAAVPGDVVAGAAKPAKPKALAAPGITPPILILPAGRYWVTAFAEKEGELDAFFTIMKAAGSVHVETTEHIGSPGTAAAKQGSFYIFSVSNSVAWPVGVFGRPTVAGPNVHSAADTVQAPDLPTPASTVTDFLDDLGKMFGGTGGMIAAGVVVWLLTQGSNRK